MEVRQALRFAPIRKSALHPQGSSGHPLAPPRRDGRRTGATCLRWGNERKTPSIAPAMKPAKLQVAAVQMKFRPTIGENVERIIELIHSSARDGVDAILFPECAVTGYR